jgi:hypothetical protein
MTTTTVPLAPGVRECALLCANGRSRDRAGNKGWTILLLALGLSSSAGATPTAPKAEVLAPITADNWRQHPHIVAVRRLYETVQASVNKGELKEKAREETACTSGSTTKTILLDAAGRVRRYRVDRGGEDSALHLEHTYDEGGVLRFVLITGRAISGASLEHRIYFDDKGLRLWEEHKATEPGSPWPASWPASWPAADLTLRDPRAAYRAPGC